MKNMQKILVTGATGFIGQGLVKALEQDEAAQIWCAAENCQPRGGGRTHTIHLDFTRPFDESILPKELDHIIHLAQFPDHRLFPGKARDLFAVNTDSTLHLLEYGRRVGLTSFVFTSSGNVYDPDFTGAPLKETDPVRSSDFYSLTKIASEMLVASYEKFFPCITFRIFNCYGEGQKGRLVSSLVERVEKDEEVTIYGDEGLSINPIHRDDAAVFMIKALELRQSAVLNLGGEETLTIKQMAHIIGRVMNREPRFAHVPAGRQRELVGDISRLVDMLGCRPRVAFEEGVARVIKAGRAS